MCAILNAVGLDVRKQVFILIPLTRANQLNIFSFIAHLSGEMKKQICKIKALISFKTL